MSGGVLFQEALRSLRKMELIDVAERDVVAVLEANRQGPLSFFYEAMAEAGLDRSLARTRGAAVFFCYCAGQLADDLADGECGYQSDPFRTGPSAQFILQNLFFATAVDGGVDLETVRSAASDLVRGAAAQHLEVRTRVWSAALAEEVALGISGLQFSAYLRLLWMGTRLAALGGSVGLQLGVVAHVARDASTGDRRYHSLAAEERERLRQWALTEVRSLREHQLRCVEGVLRWAEPLLEAAA